MVRALRRINRAGQSLAEINLRAADLRDASLLGADLSRADLRSADLRDANFFLADLRSADLRSADLRDASLLSADLSRADLRDADLRFAVLSRSIFLATDLRNAQNLTLDQFLGAYPPFLCGAALPPELAEIRNRDCEALPQVLAAQYPGLSEEDAQRWVDEAKAREWD